MFFHFGSDQSAQLHTRGLLFIDSFNAESYWRGPKYEGGGGGGGGVERGGVWHCDVDKTICL